MASKYNDTQGQDVGPPKTPLLLGLVGIAVKLLYNSSTATTTVIVKISLASALLSFAVAVQVGTAYRG